MQPTDLVAGKPVAHNIESANRIRKVINCHPKLVVAGIIFVVISPLSWRFSHSLGQITSATYYMAVWFMKGLLSNGSHFINLAEAWLGPLLFANVIESGPKFAGSIRGFLNAVTVLL